MSIPTGRQQAAPITASGSFKIAVVAGIPVRVHPTFFLLLVWIAALHWIEGGPKEAAAGVIFVVVLFACVVLHELGHAFMARRFGIETRDVTLLPIGGVAAMERLPEKPAQEILVALAGPAVNLVIVAILILVFGDRLDLERAVRVEDHHTDLLQDIAVANIVLFVFNLIPAFPMDGGRVLRALLTPWLGYTRATHVAASFGQGLAVLFGVLGLIGNPFLVLIAIFIFLSAAGEAGYVEMKDQVRGHRVHDAMIESFETLGPDADADAAAALLLRTTQQEFPVVDQNGGLAGLLTREALISALQATGGRTPVIDIMTRDLPVVSEFDELEPVMRMLQERAVPAVAVVTESGRLVGYINPQNLSEFFWIGTARSKRRQS